MDNQLLEDTSTTTSSYSELFEQALPMYLAIGMTYDEYYNGDPTLCRAYRKAHELKWEQINTQLWLQGAYFNDALTKALGNAFRKKGEKPLSYLTEPIQLSNQDEELRKAKLKKQKEKELKAAKLWMEQFASMHNHSSQ